MYDGNRCQSGYNRTQSANLPNIRSGAASGFLRTRWDELWHDYGGPFK